MSLLSPDARARLIEDARVVAPAWAVARLLVLVGVVMAHAVADANGTDPVQLGEGLAAWDGTFYRDIASGGYGSLDPEALRFFPLFPLVGRAASVLTLGDVTVGLVLVANVAAFGVGIATRRLVLQEQGDQELADRATWLMMLVPSAFVLVFAYSESLFLLFAIICFSRLRARAWWQAAIFGFLAALTRPFGLVLAVPALIEVVRSYRQDPERVGVAAVGAIAAPAVGTGVYLAVSGVWFDSWRGPMDAQSSFRGSLVDPFSRVGRGVGDLLGNETFGDGLHLPFALVGLFLLVVLIRTWPASYSVFAGLILVTSLSADNWNSLERYILDAFPLVLALAVILRGERLLRLALAVCGGGMVALTSLTLLGVYVP
jgi:hypothetical protein